MAKKYFRFVQETFQLFVSLIDSGAIKEEDYWPLMNAVTDKVFNDKEPDFTGWTPIMKVTYERFIADQKTSNGTFDRRSITSRENGKKGGRPKKN